MAIDIEALLLPLPGGDPCGADLRYHPISDQIKEARREEADISQGVWKREVKLADYPSVIKLSKEAFSKRGKDLQVAAWLTEALLHQEGFVGLRQGLVLIQRLLETYWDSIYPRPDDDGDLEMRATPLRFVGSQLDSAVKYVAITKGGHSWYDYHESRTVPSEDEAQRDSNKATERSEAIAEGKVTLEDFQRGFDATPGPFSVELYQRLGELIEFVNALGTYCDEKFGDAAPDYTPLRKSLEEVHQTARILMKQKGLSEPAAVEPEEAVAEEPPESTEPVYAEAAPAVKPAAPVAKRSGGGAPLNADDAAEAILAGARFMRQENPMNPAPYLVTRALRWGELRAGGGAPHPMLMTAPPTEVRTELKRLATEGQWDQVLELAEEAAGKPWGRAWLDVQRYAVFGLQFAGNDAVANVILASLRALLTDLPQMTEWTLADDTPVANPETQQWLKDQVLPKVSEVVAPAPPEPQWYPPPPPVQAYESANGEPAPPDAYDLAMDAARNGRTEEALDILSREIAHERSGRGRYLRKVQLAQICLSTGNQEIGSPILQELAEEIERRALEDWETADLVAQPLALLYRCMDDSAEMAADKRKLYRQICRLDPSRALGLR